MEADMTTRSDTEGLLREARTAMYGLISERVVSGAPGDWMRFEEAVNAEFDRLLDTPPDTDPAPEPVHPMTPQEFAEKFGSPDTDPSGLRCQFVERETCGESESHWKHGPGPGNGLMRHTFLATPPDTDPSGPGDVEVSDDGSRRVPTDLLVRGENSGLWSDVEAAWDALKADLLPGEQRHVDDHHYAIERAVWDAVAGDAARATYAAIQESRAGEADTDPSGLGDVEAVWMERFALTQGARREMLEFAIALADDRLNKRGDPIACHIYLVNALHGEPLSDALQDEARALLEAME